MTEFHTPIYEELPGDLGNPTPDVTRDSLYNNAFEQAIDALEQGTLTPEQESIVLGRLAARVSQDYN